MGTSKVDIQIAILREISDKLDRLLPEEEKEDKKGAVNILKNNALKPDQKTTYDYIVFTDGGCDFNPGGKGGYGAIIIKNNEKEYSEIQEICGGYKSTTNNRMEIMAVIKALEMIPKSTTILVNSDSEYLVKTMKKEYQTKKNVDLWERLDEAMEDKIIHVRWVRGHSGEMYNELCDKLALKGRKGKLEVDEGYKP